MVGSFSSNFFLKSSDYVPERLKAAINQATSSMMENGLYRFYQSFAGFLVESQIYGLIGKANDNSHTLSMGQFKAPLIMLFTFCAFAAIVFALELGIDYFNRRKFHWLINFLINFKSILNLFQINCKTILNQF